MNRFRRRLSLADRHGCHVPYPRASCTARYALKRRRAISAIGVTISTFANSKTADRTLSTTRQKISIERPGTLDRPGYHSHQQGGRGHFQAGLVSGPRRTNLGHSPDFDPEEFPPPFPSHVQSCTPRLVTVYHNLTLPGPGGTMPPRYRFHPEKSPPRRSLLRSSRGARSGERCLYRRRRHWPIPCLTARRQFREASCGRATRKRPSTILDRDAIPTKAGATVLVHRDPVDERPL